MKVTNDSSARKANFRRAKVLVIDDNQDHWVVIQKAMLATLPEVTPVWVDTPRQALVLLQEASYQEWDMPKLILLDLYLPERKDGWQLLKQIKSMASPFDHIPIVMLSSSVNNSDITEAYTLGVSSYLVKPIDFEGWLTYFTEIRQYWWETVTLPLLQYKL